MTSRSRSSRSPQAKDSVPNPFAIYHNARFAIFLGGQVPNNPFRGTAVYEDDPDLGGILRIPLDGDLPGRPEIIVVQREWDGLITQDSLYGCDYCLVLIKSRKDPPDASPPETSFVAGNGGRAGSGPTGEQNRAGGRRG